MQSGGAFKWEVGRRYIVSASIKGASGELDNFQFQAGAQGTPSFSVTTSFATYSKIIEVNTQSNSLFIVNTNNGTSPWYIDNVSVKALQNTWIDNISVKEEGTATGWTNADQQLDIPQTALQSYNQLAWFDGVGDYVSIADHSDFSFEADIAFSVSAWINMNDATTFPIVCKDTTSHKEWALSTGSDDKLYFILHDNSASAYQSRKYNTALTSYEGDWIHVVGTYNGGESDPDAGINLYINGEVVDDTDNNSGSYTAMEDKDGVVAIGARLEGPTYANGAITEVTIFDVNLTQAEVNELYNGGKALDATTHSKSTDLMGYWRNNGLATWQDETAFNRDGTPTSLTETILQQAGVDASRDCQGFLMNRQKDTNSLNLDGLADDSTYNGPGVYIPHPIDATTGEFDADGDGTGDYTIEFWVKNSTADGKNRMCFQNCYKDGSNNFSGNAIYFDGVGRFDWLIYYDDASNYIACADNVTGYSDGEWHHVVLAVDKSDKSYFIVDNVVKVITDVSTHVNVNLWKFPPKVGTDRLSDVQANSSGIGTHSLMGQIDEVKIYNRLLTFYESDGSIPEATETITSGEVKRNYNAGKRSHR